MKTRVTGCDLLRLNSRWTWLYLDARGRFHVIPYDGNETFNVPEGGGRLSAQALRRITPFRRSGA